MMNVYQGGTGIFTKKQKTIIGAVIVVVIVCVVGVAAFLTMQGKQIAEQEIEQYLSELSYQTSYKVSQRIETNVNTLLRLEEELTIVSTEEGQKIIDSTIYHSAYEKIGYIDLQGKFRVGDTIEIDISTSNVMKDLKEGKNSVSDELISMPDGKKGAIYAIAENANNHVALAGWIPTDTMKLLLNTDTFEGIGFSHIVSLEGEYILKSQNKNAVLNKGDNFFDMLEEYGHVTKKQDLQKMKERMQGGKTGSIEYTINDGEKRSLTYVPIEKAGWYLLSIVPSQAYVYNINQFTSHSIFAIASISVLLFTILSVALVLTSFRKNKIISTIAYIDPVTNGFTKTRFDQEIKRKMEHFTPFTYIMLDIRKFKLINELQGSSGGDKVLKHVYQCMQLHLQEDEFASRIQADNFEMILNTTDKEEIEKRLLAIAEEINLFNKERENPYYLPIDYGIYLVDSKNETLINMRDRANSARKNNKDNSQTHLCSCIYYSDLERIQMVREKEIDNAMEKALENEEFIVYLQPKVNVHTNKVAGAEALIRWDSPTMGFLPPDTFIPYFEKTGFIVKLDLFVFEKVCQQIHEWLQQGIEPIPISVNLSKRDIYDNQYLERYKKIQEQYQVPSHLLEMEFTETLFFEDLEILKRAIQDVHEAGYQCSIDDFGSGYSSLALLKEIPVDILKLDKTFFDNVSNQRGDKVVEHVIALAKDLDMITIAEGVETAIQVERLKNVKCDLIQGYVYYKPMTIENFNKIVDNDYHIIEV